MLKPKTVQEFLDALETHDKALKDIEKRWKELLTTLDALRKRLDDLENEDSEEDADDLLDD